MVEDPQTTAKNGVELTTLQRKRLAYHKSMIDNIVGRVQNAKIEVRQPFKLKVSHDDRIYESNDRRLPRWAVWLQPGCGWADSDEKHDTRTVIYNHCLLLNK
jgi:hypothetical protein